MEEVTTFIGMTIQCRQQNKTSRTLAFLAGRTAAGLANTFMEASFYV